MTEQVVTEAQMFLAASLTTEIEGLRQARPGLLLVLVLQRLVLWRTGIGFDRSAMTQSFSCRAALLGSQQIFPLYRRQTEPTWNHLAVKFTLPRLGVRVTDIICATKLQRL